MSVEGWKTGTLGKLCKIAIGGTPTRENPEYWDSQKETDNLWVSIRDMNQRVINDTAEYITDEGVKNSNAKLQHEGTILLSFKLTIGRVAFAGRQLYTNEAIAALETEQLDSNYLYYGLQQWDLLQDVDQAIKGATLNKAKLNKIEFQYPVSLQEQTQIATILSTIDRAIEQTEALIAKQQRIKTGLMQDLLTKGIDKDGNIRSEETHEFKDSPLGRIPVEWEVKKIGEFTDIVRGASPRPKGDPRYYGGSIPRLMVEDVTRDGKWVIPRVDSLTLIGASLSRPMPAGSLTVVCSGTVGVPSFLAVDACIHDGFLGFSRIGSCCEKEFIYYTFVFMIDQLDTAATHGGVFTNLTTDIVKNLNLKIPPVSEQGTIINILKRQDELVNKYRRSLNKIVKEKQGLMQDLLTGKVRVTELLDKPPN